MRDNTHMQNCVQIVDIELTKNHFLPTPAGSFHGGFHRVNLTLRERAVLEVELSFRTASYDAGLLFLAVQRNHSGYLAAGLRDNAMEIILKRDEQTPPQTLVSFDFILRNTSLSPSDWHTLSVQYDQSQLSVNVDNTNIHTQNLTLDDSFSTVFFAGLDSFLSHSLFFDFPVASYFAGCLANVSVDFLPVVFVPDHQNGVGIECCLIPRTPSWCFASPYSNLSIPTTTLNHESLLVSFRLKPFADGLVLFTQTADPSQSLLLTLSGRNLSLIVSNTQQNNTETLHCPELPSSREWHLVEITSTMDSIQCAVEKTVDDVQLSTRLSLSFTEVILGSAEVQGVHRPSFQGCIEQFELNSAQIRPSLGVQVLQNGEPLQWEELTFELHPLTVDEGNKVRLSEQNIVITFHEELFPDNFASLHQQDMEKAIQIRVLEGPYQGRFIHGTSGTPTSAFPYSALASQDNETQIFYRHSISSENVTDEVTIELSVECGSGAVLRVLFNGTLEISVIENNDHPLMLTQNDAISIAAGTLRVISPNHLTVVGQENPNPNSIYYAFQSIDPMGICRDVHCDEERGKLVKTYNPNLPAMFFSQKDLNEGNVSFQHYEKFGTEPVVIRLLASTNGGSINVTIDVYPYQGRIDFVAQPGSCLFVKEGSTALVELSHLNTTTNFVDQNPTVSYDLVKEPEFGYLERFTLYYHVYPDWHRLSGITPSARRNQISDLNYFTQDDVNRGYVRYVHNHTFTSTQGSDTFRFRLRSTNFTADNKSLCVVIVPEATLVKPRIFISAKLVVVNESQSVRINADSLVTSHTDAYAVSIEEMGIVYILEAVPSHGQLMVDERELGVGDNFTVDEVSSGLLSYAHGGTENHADSFRVSAIATTTATLLILTPDPSLAVTVNVSITPVNNHEPVLISNLPINPSEGGFIHITREHILVTDEDTPRETLNIFIRKKGETPIGYFAFEDYADSPTSRFTMQDVYEGRIIYKHRLNTSAPLSQTQIVRVDDGNREHFVRGVSALIQCMLVVLILHGLCASVSVITNCYCGSPTHPQGYDSSYLLHLHHVFTCTCMYFCSWIYHTHVRKCS